MYCQGRTAVKGNGREFFAVSLKCRAWTCPTCAPERQNRLIACAIDGKPNRFLTLTSKRRDNMTPIQAARELARCWRLVRLRLMRLYKKKSLPFLAVFEQTKLGWPHLHILLRAPFLDQKIISTWMDELSGSPVVHIEKLENPKKAARYCAKYIGKDTHKFGTCKRYWQSKDYRVVQKKYAQQRRLPPGDWYVHSWPITRWIDSMKTLGFSVTLAGSDAAYASLAQLTIEGLGGP